MTACIWGIVPILEKFGLAKLSPFTALFYRCLGVLLGIVLLGIFAVRPNDVKSVDVRTLLILVAAGFLASFVAQVTFYHALKIGEVSRVVPISGAYHLIAFVLGILVFKEAVTPAKIAGVLLVVSGVWLLR